MSQKYLLEQNTLKFQKYHHKLNISYVHLYLFSEVFPMQMEGVRLVVNKGLSNHFQVS